MQVELVNPDTQQWQITRTAPARTRYKRAFLEVLGVGADLDCREVNEVPDQLLEALVTVQFARSSAVARKLLDRIRRDYPKQQ